MATLAVIPREAGAQTMGRAGSLSGEVVDAATSEPLSAAVVRLRAAGAAAEGSVRITATDERGRYRFDRVEPGVYVLAVGRLGFRSVELGIDMADTLDSRVSVGLELEPIALEPVRVRSDRVEPYDRFMSNDVMGAGQAAAVEMRQRRYLASDVRSLTHTELITAVTLGESDLFRALQRMPGVSTRDEWTAELWTRGSDWDQTRVWFDGLPLFNPLHGGGVLSGVNSDGVGAVYLHPGVRPVRLGEGAAVLELQSRAAGGSGEVRGAAELSLASARIAADQRIGDGRTGWTVALRRTWIDWFTAGLERAFDVHDAYVPYNFDDVMARVDHRLANDVNIEASTLYERDRLTGDVPDVIHGSRIAWGNLAARVTLDAPLRRHRLRHTIGYAGYSVDSDTAGIDSDRTDGLNAPRAAAIDHALRFVVLRAELVPAAAGADGWSAGVELSRHTRRAVGETPPTHLEYRAAREDSIDQNDALTMFAGWLERRWTARRFEVELGMRADAGTRVAHAGSVRLAPRATIRLSPADGLTLSAGAGRSWQYSQSLVPVAYFRNEFPSGQLWMMANDAVPALRTDIATLGGELWLEGSWLLSATAWVRDSDGVIIPDPRPGATRGRPLFVAVDQWGRGAELGLRRLRGRLTGAIGWSIGRTVQEMGDLEFPARGDRAHEVDVTALYRIGPAVRVGGAFTWATGSPFTRIVDLEPVPEGATTRIGVAGLPGAGRLATWASLDLMVEWMKSFRGWRLGTYVQIRNVLGRDNTATYSGTSAFCASGGYVTTAEGVLCLPDHSPAVQRDEFLAGMPRIPLLGFRVQF